MGRAGQGASCFHKVLTFTILQHANVEVKEECREVMTV